MKVEDICKLPIADLADENCVLFLWATFPTLPDAFKVIEAWNFNYKTIGFLWVKTNPGRWKWPAEDLSKRLHALGLKKFLDWITMFGIGYYSKSGTEPCLLATKGRMKPVTNKISSVVYAPREAHSKKPDIVREKIVELFGPLPRIELFARQETEGWAVMGNEIDGKTIEERMEVKND